MKTGRTYLFVGGVRHGQIVMIDAGDDAALFQIGVARGGVWERQAYTKRAVWRGRDRKFYFALESMTDEEALAAFVKAAAAGPTSG